MTATSTIAEMEMYLRFKDEPNLDPGEARIFDESWEEMIAAGRYNAALKIRYRTHEEDAELFEAVLSSGHRDNISVYELDAGNIAVMSVNDRFGYCGMETFLDGKEQHSVFMQNPDEEIEVDQPHDADEDDEPNRWTDLSDNELAAILMEYCY